MNVLLTTSLNWMYISQIYSVLLIKVLYVLQSKLFDKFHIFYALVCIPDALSDTKPGVGRPY